MLNLALFDRIDLRQRPMAQRFIADSFLRFDYRSLDIQVEGIERIPKRPCILALNHTDAFNYWPLQYHLHRHYDQYTAAWVKGKNFEQPFVAYFMRVTNNIPLPSRGYLVTRDFLSAVGRAPTDDEYRVVRDAFNAGTPIEEGVPRELLERPRDILGQRFDPQGEDYIATMESLFESMMASFVRINEHALSIGLHLLVYPEGTRSVQLSRGRGGIGQMALHLNVPIVPIGCSGGDLIYPTKAPFSKPGRIVYRIGDAIEPGELDSLRPDEPYAPFTRGADAHVDAFQQVADITMDRINTLVDDRHRFSEDKVSLGVSGASRFL